MASDRRFGLPHPLDADVSEGSASGRKAGVWETLRRALGATTPVTPVPDPRHAGDGTPRPPSAPAPPPAAASAAQRPPDPVVPALPLASLPAERVPFLEDSGVPESPEPVVASPEPASAPSAAEPQPGRPPAEPQPEGPPTPGSAEPPGRPSRLARGLASFSSDNAERGKKFAHLLRDKPPGAVRRAGVPRKRS